MCIYNRHKGSNIKSYIDFDKITKFYRKLAETYWRNGKKDIGGHIYGHDEFIEKETEYLCRKYEESLRRAGIDKYEVTTREGCWQELEDEK